MPCIQQLTHLTPHIGFYIQKYHTHIGMIAKTGIKMELPMKSKKGIPNTYVDLSPFLSVEATGVYIPIG
jgi:hypothetical protein